MYGYGDRIDIEDLIGKTFTKVFVNDDKSEITFIEDNGQKYCMLHDQDCCESVYVEDICGNLNNLIGSPILIAREDTNEGENPEDVTPPEYQESFTWTFYNLATQKGHVTIRWYGESNGYYSESVEIYKEVEDD